jgi:hypothetical protein
MRLIVITLAIALNAPILPGQSDSTTAQRDSAQIKVSDTVRVWAPAMKLNGRRGVVSRLPSDSLAFIAPSGFRQTSREFTAAYASINRIDLLVGRKRSVGRAGGQMLLSGALGAIGGGLIGVGLGTLLYESNKDRYQGSEFDSRAMAQLIVGTVGFTIGGAGGLISGAIVGARPHEQWQRVR